MGASMGAMGAVQSACDGSKSMGGCLRRGWWGGRGRLEPQPGWREALERDLAALASVSFARRPDLGLEPVQTSRHALPGESGEPGVAASVQMHQPGAVSDPDGSDAAGTEGLCSPVVPALPLDERESRLRAVGVTAEAASTRASPPEGQTGLQALAIAADLADMDGGVGKDGNGVTGAGAACLHIVQGQMHVRDGGDGGGASGMEAGKGNGQEVCARELTPAEEDVEGRDARGRKVRKKLECAECGGAYRQGDLVRHRNSRRHKLAILDRRMVAGVASTGP